MATHQSAEKRYRQSLRRREQNRSAKAAIRTSLKAALAALAANNTAEAKTHARRAEQLLAKAASKGVIHKKAAQRTISRLASRVNK
ncbi:MAG: 30S ribosomal protein S20 [Bdellovibrionota bacterium]|nr:MAG: 30S ribosomal protein S20 [Bdellovibrionota bacterium]